MKRSDVFKGKYLKAEELCGRSVTVTIERTDMEDITNSQSGNTEQKAVVYFRGKEKGLVLNQINWTSIEDQWGDETDGWPGRQITLFATTTPFGGKIVPCLRIKPGTSAPVAQAEEFIKQQVAPRPAQATPGIANIEQHIQPESDMVSDDDVPF